MKTIYMDYLRMMAFCAFSTAEVNSRNFYHIVKKVQGAAKKQIRQQGYQPFESGGAFYSELRLYDDDYNSTTEQFASIEEAYEDALLFKNTQKQ